MSMHIKAVVHVTIQVSDVERSRRLYREVFGMVEMPRPPELDFPGAWFQCGDCQLHIVGQPAPDPASRRHTAVTVASLDVARRVAEAAGLQCSPDSPVGGGRRFFLLDPDDNRWELVEPGR